MGIASRLASLIILSAFAIAFTFSQYFYNLTYNAEISNANSSIEELLQIVSPTASIAAFVSDEELAKEVINGLMRSKNVKAAAFTSDNIKYEINVKYLQQKNVQIFAIYHPFLTDEKIAEIMVMPDFSYIERQAARISTGNTYALYLLAVIVTLVSIIICYFLVTQPLKRVSNLLHILEPGTKDRIITPRYHEGTEIGVLVSDTNAILNNVEQKIKQERKLRAEIEALERRFRMLFENAKSSIVLLDTEGKLVLFNEAFVSLIESTGLYINKQNTEFGELLMELFLEPELVLTSVRDAFTHGEIAMGEYQLRSFNQAANMWVQLFATQIDTDDGERYYQVMLNDISKRKLELEVLAKQADFDVLTKVLNRNGGEKAIQTKVQQKVEFALVLIDLNGFKQVNDTHGHDAGDEVLMSVANRLTDTIRHDDVVIRWGGDEFVLLLKTENGREDMVRNAMDKVRNLIKKPIELADSGLSVTIGMSAGVAFYPGTASSIDTLMKHADRAMYKAKEVKHTDPDNYLFFASTNKSED